MFDPYLIRKDFPMFTNKTKMQGRDLVFLDNASTTFKPQCVIDACNLYYSKETSNSGRGDYDLMYKVDTTVEEARKNLISKYEDAETYASTKHPVADEKLMDTLAETKLPVEICITSNTFTKAVDEAKNHPVRKFFDKGIVVTINTDDPVFFKTTLLDELWICFSELNFSMEEIKQLLVYSFQASFMSDSEKSDWINKVNSAF